MISEISEEEIEESGEIDVLDHLIFDESAELVIVLKKRRSDEVGVLAFDASGIIVNKYLVIIEEKVKEEVSEKEGEEVEQK